MEYWLYDGRRHYKVGLNAVVGRPLEERSFEPVRFDEMRARCVRHPRARTRHGSQRRVRVVELSRRRSPGSRASATSSGSPTASSRWQWSGPRTTGTSRSGRARTRGGSSRARCRGSSTPSSRPRRSAATRRAVSAPSRSRSCPSGSGSRHCTPATGSRSSPRARRPTRSCASTSVRRRPRPPRRRTPRPTPSACSSSAGRCSPRSTGSTPCSRSASRSCGSASQRRRPRLGRGPARPARPRGALPADVRHLGGHRAHAARGRCNATSGSARSTTRRVSTTATASAIDHVLLESDYPHQDGTWPDTQEILHEQIGHFPPDDVRKLTWENASTRVRVPGTRRRAA